MASLRQLRQRLRSIQGTKQIMRAMQLVSASKLKRAQGRLLQARAVLGFLDGLLQRVLASVPALDHPLCAVRAEGPSALVLFTSDSGLCGAYNTNLIQLAESHLRRDTARATQLITVGKKGHRYFLRRGYASAASYLDLAGRPDLATAEAIGRELMERFLAGRVASVELLYSRFVSSSVYRPAVLQWLPIRLEATTESQGHNVTGSHAEEYIFEPSAQRIFDDLLPRWALATFQRAMLEAFTSEHSARMIAMKNATDNAEELLKSLTRQRNRIRQAAITKELSEIVGTAEALK
ncbi:MAG: ATP synthase F1 subunit gamma [Candidatus Omnitrophica bacterium]|nr:ATP synthase F1 subunit gamma [Candidatus Omnitrophota bacterium]